MRLEIKQIPSPIHIPVLIKKTDSNAFRIQNDDGDTVLAVNSTDGATGNTYFVNLTPNGGTLEANGYQKVGLRAFFQLTGNGTQTALTRAFHGQMALKDSVSHSGLGAKGAIGFFYSFVHDSIGTCADGMGGYFQSTILAAGSTVNAGLVNSMKGLRLRIGYGSAGGSGACNEGHALYIDDLAGVDATHTFGDIVLFRVPEVKGTGITNGYIFKTESGDWDIGDDFYFHNAGSGLPYAEIYAYNVAAAHAFAGTGIANKVQVSAFATNGPSNLCTPDHTNDHITITKDGVYKVCVTLSIDSNAGTGFELGLSLFKNNGATLFNNIHSHADFAGGGGETKSISMNGLIEAGAGDTIELWCWNETNTTGISIDEVTLSVFMIGGA